MIRHPLALLLFLLTVAGFTSGVWWLSYNAALDQVETRAQANLRLAADRLVSQLQRYRDVAVLLADHPVLEALVAAPWNDPSLANEMLLRTADKTGRLEIDLVDRSGQPLASSTPRGSGDHRGAPYFERAMQGTLGVYTAQRAGTGQRVFTYAAPLYAPEGPVRGAVIVTVDVSVLEADWSGQPQAVFFTDPRGIILISNRAELLLKARERGAVTDRSEYLEHGIEEVGEHTIWRLESGPYLPERAMHLSLDLPVIGMTGEILSDVAPARALALLWAAVAGAVGLVFGSVLLVLLGRRHVLAAQLQAEARAKAVLEDRVAARTRELSATNAALRREIRERQDAEEVLKHTQADLVQAGKLTALGQMSAGISHELNQPLMAIRSFAENAEVFLTRGNEEAARRNLGRISELARRMGRIIQNLRAFARQESEAIRDVDLAAVVTAVLEISESRLASSGVTLDWTPPQTQPLVRGGEVRLQQVFLNLVSNALDAMEEQTERRLQITIAQQGETVLLQVRDTGPGIAEPEKIFDPFYTRRKIGRAEGMGLGLSISYGLVQSFGGVIRGRNHEEGGAIFTVELPAARMEQVA